jgi:hypothetical protein
MKHYIVAALLSVAAAPVFAEPSCAPTETMKPVWEAIKSFESEGGKVIAFKINDGGCYEIYGSLNDTNMEVFFDPATGVEIERINA